MYWRPCVSRHWNLTHHRRCNLTHETWLKFHSANSSFLRFSPCSRAKEKSPPFLAGSFLCIPCMKRYRKKITLKFSSHECSCCSGQIEQWKRQVLLCPLGLTLYPWLTSSLWLISYLLSIIYQRAVTVNPCPCYFLFIYAFYFSGLRHFFRAYKFFPSRVRTRTASECLAVNRH